MKLIIGLGNPGRVYADSRHNIGFLVARALAQECGIRLGRERNILASSGTGKISHYGITIALPLTFMNLSGIAVEALLVRHRVAIEDLLVVCDDLDLELGRIRLRSGGSAGGHKGVGSVIEHAGGTDFCRLRIGIGRPVKGDPAEYVLSGFTKHEKRELPGIIERAVACSRMWVVRGVAESMNAFNSNRVNPPGTPA